VRRGPTTTTRCFTPGGAEPSAFRGAGRRIPVRVSDAQGAGQPVKRNRQFFLDPQRPGPACVPLEIGPQGEAEPANGRSDQSRELGQRCALQHERGGSPWRSAGSQIGRPAPVSIIAAQTPGGVLDGRYAVFGRGGQGPWRWWDHNPPGRQGWSGPRGWRAASWVEGKPEERSLRPAPALLRRRLIFRRRVQERLRPAPGPPLPVRSASREFRNFRESASKATNVGLDAPSTTSRIRA